MPAMEKIASSMINNIMPLNDLDYHETLMANEGVALVYFTSPHCGTCWVLKQALQRLLIESADLGLSDVCVYEVDAVHNGGLIHEFEIFHLPTLYLYQNGRFHAELHCEASVPRISNAIHAALAQPAQEEP